MRRLSSDDVSAMRSALDVYADSFDDVPSYRAAQPDDTYLERLLARDDFIQLVAADGGTIVGAMSAYVLPKFEQARSEIYIYDLAVDENWRRQGIAERMIEHLKSIAGDVGAWVIYVQADHGDEPAIALYAKLGSREDVIHFDITP
ncbi:AAC(3)-I family aminoglycoside N-acetyltransferase [Tsuneonella dongtanensis]